MKEAEEQAILRLLINKPHSVKMLKHALGPRGVTNVGPEKLHNMLMRMREQGKVVFDIHLGRWQPANTHSEQKQMHG